MEKYGRAGEATDNNLVSVLHLPFILLYFLFYFLIFNFNPLEHTAGCETAEPSMLFC
jgi:hypothetical protein